MDIQSVKIMLESVRDNEVRVQLLKCLKDVLPTMTPKDICEIVCPYKGDDALHTLITELFSACNSEVSVDDIRDFMSCFHTDCYKLRLLKFLLGKMIVFDTNYTESIIVMFTETYCKIGALNALVVKSSLITPFIARSVLSMFETPTQADVLRCMLSKIDTISQHDYEYICNGVDKSCREVLLPNVRETFENPSICVAGLNVDKSSLMKGLPTLIEERSVRVYITRQEDGFLVVLDSMRVLCPLNSNIRIGSGPRILCDGVTVY